LDSRFELRTTIVPPADVTITDQAANSSLFATSIAAKECARGVDPNVISFGAKQKAVAHQSVLMPDTQIAAVT
jgi:hypothetical protein